MNIMIIKFLMFSLCLILGIIFFISTFACKFYIAFTIGRKFDQLFPYPKFIFLTSSGLWGKITRAHFYASFVVTKNKSARRLMYQNYYSDYDFNGNVTPRQRKVCWAYFVCLFSTFISFGLMCYFESLFHVHQI